jgi:hypothetical protein
MSTKAHDLARKLHELAKRGVGGEKTNAEQKLRALMAKHGITLEQLDDELRVERMFKYRSAQEQQFVGQVISSVVGKSHRLYKWTSERNKLFTLLNTAEHLEVIIRLEHYWPLWLGELKLFYRAFIQANRLFAKPVETTGEEPEPPPPTQQELDEAARMWAMANTVKTSSPTKRLERSEKLTA